MSSSPRRLAVAVCVSAILGVLAAGCGSSGSGNTLTLYSAQHEQMTNALVKAFERQTGATVRVRFGEDEGLASQIIQEGSASPADVLLTENTPPLELLTEKGLLSKVDGATLKLVPARYDSPRGRWVGVVARETALIYDPKLLSAGELPASILDLAKPAWKGRLAIAPSEPDFVPIVGAIDRLEGRANTERWLQGFASNAAHYDDNEGIVAAVEAGQVAAGVINHYYWYAQAAEVGRANVRSKLYYFGHEDPGALVNVSGAAALRSSRDPGLARRFLAFLVGREGQSAITHSGDWEYPLNAGVAPPPGLEPLASLHAPEIGPADLGDGSTSLQLIQQAGLL